MHAWFVLPQDFHPNKLKNIVVEIYAILFERSKEWNKGFENFFLLRDNIQWYFLLTAISALRFTSSANSALRSTEDFVDIFFCCLSPLNTKINFINRIKFNYEKITLWNIKLSVYANYSTARVDAQTRSEGASSYFR